MRSKKALFNISTNLILQIIVILYGFVVPKIIINNYGSNVNGLVSSISQFLAYITLLESGFGPVVKSLLYKPIVEKNKETIANILRTTESFFRKVAVIFVLYIVVLCLFYPFLVSNSFDFLFTISLILIISISIFAEYFFGMTYRLFLQADQKTYVISIIQIMSYFASIILIIITVRLHFSIQMVKLISGIAFITRPLLQNFYVKREYNINLKEASKEYEISQKWDGLAQHIAAVIHANTDVTLLTIFTNLIEVSIYSVYFLVVTGIKNLIKSFINGIDATFGSMIANNEKENLSVRFSMYEVLYNVINTIVFTSTIILITPFITVYTRGITDANYIRYTFGALIVVSEYIWAIRQPYNELVKAAGHFKETRVGAWVECISNIVISVILVKRYGLIGVAIGTIVAMTIRTVEFVYHTNKYILGRPIWESVKKILLVIAETLIIVFICGYLPYVENINYINWIINAVMVTTVAVIITSVLNIVFFKKEFKEVITIIKNIFRKKQKA